MHRKWKTALWVAGLVGGLALYACTKQTVDVQKDKIRASLSTLASDEMEGRAPGTRGGEKAAEFIATSFAGVGLKPAADGSYLQPVRMVGVAPEDGWVLEWSKDGRKTPLKASDQCVANPGVAEEEVNLEDAPMVFVGYGIVAPEVPWNDYQGADVKGKVVVALVNDPPSDDPTFFGGAALTYYGRWTYKLEEAARQGAAGVILVHNTEMAGYPWSVVQTSWSGEQFTLPREGDKSTVLEAWISQDTAEALFRQEGFSFQEAVDRAGKQGFEPIPLSTKVSYHAQAAIREVDSPNVVGWIEGSDPELKDQYIVLTSHYDHLGIGPEVNGDRIYNGALDNASGTALLIEVGRVLAAHRSELGRSLVFAAVTGEEQGLLGSEYYVEHPVFPLSQTVANINFDGINVWGETEDMVAMGAERSTIRNVVQDVFSKLNIQRVADPFPEKGYFFRSDQFSFVKAGVPAVYYDFGLRFRGKSADWGENLMNQYIEKHYHQPSDEYDPSWPLDGAVQMGRVVVQTAEELSTQKERPNWNEGDPFARAAAK